ncbi:MAG: cysteine desulfurase family protein [Promethearchaeota archaeon]
MTCLDYQAARPVDPAVFEEMTPYMLQKFGNPSSLHSIGDVATEALENARRVIAKFVNATRADEIIFTSGATESNNLGIIGFATRNEKKGKHVIISEIEHISIHNIGKYLVKKGFEVSKIPVSFSGRIKIENLKERIRDDTILISVQFANNEVGTMQPIKEIGAIAREKGIAFHVDAVAAEGLAPIDVIANNIDLLTLSSNDMYGPKGVGALYIRKGTRIAPLMIGGGQERGLRSGSENLPGIVGMAKAAEIAMERMEDESARLSRWRDMLVSEVLEKIPRSHLNGDKKRRLPNNAHFRFDFIEGESLLLGLKDEGIAIATGSACSSKTLEPSHTLISMGLLHEEAHGSLEVTLGRFTKENDIKQLMNVLPGVVARLRELSPLTRSEV